MYRFIDYLKLVDLNNQSKDRNDASLFPPGDYHLSFVGNFPGKELYFLSGQQAKEHGLERAFFVDYYIHPTVLAQSYYDIDLGHREPPFRDVIDA